MSNESSMCFAVFLNGVYEDVLEEAREAQTKTPGLICYLQPYSSRRIIRLEQEQPTTEQPITIYFSTTGQLDKVAYVANIVSWERKQVP